MYMHLTGPSVCAGSSQRCVSRTSTTSPPTPTRRWGTSTCWTGCWSVWLIQSTRSVVVVVVYVHVCLFICCWLLVHAVQVAEITLNLWYRISEELLKMDCGETTELFRPYITTLISHLCIHCRLDEDTSKVGGATVVVLLSNIISDVHVWLSCCYVISSVSPKLPPSSPPRPQFPVTEMSLEASDVQSQRL